MSANAPAPATCPICTDAMNETTVELSCGHSFHTHCAIAWFRTGADTCPLCRDVGAADLLYYPTIYERCSMLRRRARAKNAPKPLKRLYQNLLRAEARRKIDKKEFRKFKTENKTLIKDFLKLRSKQWSRNGQVRRAKIRLGLFTDPDYSIPLLNKRRRWQRRR